MHKVVLLRHGESTWNKENRFTGWHDVDLTDRGRDEAREAGRLLKEGGYVFDIAFTSVLKRAIKTLGIALDALDQLWIPVTKSWKLNERHYGALQGLNKAETVGEARRGADQNLAPQLRHSAAAADHRRPAARLARPALRGVEAGRAAADRIAEGHHRPLPSLLARVDRAGVEVGPAASSIAAHGNSLRALVKYLDNISEADIVELNIPTGIPLVYELDDDLKPLRHYYLGDPAAAAAAAARVANQDRVSADRGRLGRKKAGALFARRPSLSAN